MDLIVELSRTTIEAMDVEKGLDVLANVVAITELAKTDLQGTFFALDGYDDDPREVFEIQEIRQFFRALIEADPILFYNALSRDRDELPGYLFWTAVGFDLITFSGDRNTLQFNRYDCMEIMVSLGIPVTTGRMN